MGQSLPHRKHGLDCSAYGKVDGQPGDHHVRLINPAPFFKSNSVRLRDPARLVRFV